MVMRNCFTRKLFHVKQFLILVKLFLKDFVSRETLLELCETVSQDFCFT